MKPRIILTTLCVVLLSSITTLKAQDFTFKFINPAFGGDTFNYQWLLSSATEQNTYTDPAASSSSSKTTLQDFTDSFNRMILSQLSRSLFNQQFGENGLQPGSYSLGDFQIDISDIGSGLQIVITDNTTNDQTIISVPYY
jgi:curli production assembly/transport component CsgF